MWSEFVWYSDKSIFLVLGIRFSLQCSCYKITYFDNFQSQPYNRMYGESVPSKSFCRNVRWTKRVWSGSAGMGSSFHSNHFTILWFHNCMTVLKLEQSYFFMWSPLMRRHFFNHLLWSVFHSSNTSHITIYKFSKDLSVCSFLVLLIKGMWTLLCLGSMNGTFALFE